MCAFGWPAAAKPIVCWHLPSSQERCICSHCCNTCLPTGPAHAGMPALCRPVPEGGVGFDYRLGMGALLCLAACSCVVGTVRWTMLWAGGVLNVGAHLQLEASLA